MSGQSSDTPLFDLAEVRGPLPESGPKIIPLTKGKVALVDAADYELVSCLKWRAQRGGGRHDLWYATSDIGGRKVYMHRLIMNAPKGVGVDHRDNDGLNNRRENLRFASASENAHNSRTKSKSASKHSKYKGVHWHATRTRAGNWSGCWRATLQLPSGRKIIRYSSTEEGAKEIYDELAKKHHGDFFRS